MRKSVLLLLLATLPGLFACRDISNADPREVGAGFLDLATYDFAASGALDLKGEWEVVWGEFVDPVAVSRGRRAQTDIEYMKVPGHWKAGVPALAGASSEGFASYILRVDLPREDLVLGIKTLYIGSAFRLFANGKAVLAAGEPGSDASRSQPAFLPGVTYFPVAGKRLDLVLHVSNFDHARGGPWSTIYLGRDDQIREIRERRINFEYFLFGALLIMGVYHIGLFMIRIKDPAPLVFGLFCLLIALRTALTGERFLLQAWPAMGWETSLKLEYLTFYLGTLVFMTFVFRLFSEVVHRPVYYVFIVLALVFVGIVLFTNSSIYTRTSKGYQLVTVIGSAYMIYVMIRAIRRDIPGARLFLFGFVVLFLTVINDILYINQVIRTGYTSSVGLFSFFFVQAVMLSRRFVRAFSRMEQLTEELESRVEHRTESLTESRKELEELNAFNQQINSANNLQEVFVQIFQIFEIEFGLESVILQLVDSDRSELRTFLTSGMRPPYSTPEMVEYAGNMRVPLRPSSGMIYSVFRRQKPFYIPRLDGRENIAGAADLVALRDILKLNSFLIVPLVMGGQTIGMILATNYSGRTSLSRGDINRVSRLCRQFAGATFRSNLMREIRKEREKADELLLNILPESAAAELKTRGRVRPAFYDSVTMLVTDFKGYTRVAEHKEPEELVHELESIFLQFDAIIEKYGIEKLKTIGDSYTCAAGLPTRTDTHPLDVCLAALEIAEFMRGLSEIKNEITGENFWEMRIGIHTGPVIAGVIGKKRIQYDLWGDAVKTVQRIESDGTPGRINVSAATRDIVGQFFDLEYDGRYYNQNQEGVDSYYLNRLRAEFSSDQDGLSPVDDLRDRFAEVFRTISPKES